MFSCGRPGHKAAQFRDPCPVWYSNRIAAKKVQHYNTSAGLPATNPKRIPQVLFEPVEEVNEIFFGDNGDEIIANNTFDEYGIANDNNSCEPFSTLSFDQYTGPDKLVGKIHGKPLWRQTVRGLV